MKKPAMKIRKSTELNRLRYDMTAREYLDIHRGIQRRDGIAEVVPGPTFRVTKGGNFVEEK